MRRTAAIVIIATSGLLMAGCGSSNNATPAASSSAAKPSSSAAASTSSSATTSSSASAAAGSVSPAGAAWASKFCTGAAPLAGFKTLSLKGDTSTPEAAVAFVGTLARSIADIFTATATGVAQAGPPPAGTTSGGVNALNASATKYQAVAAAASSVDVTDAAAVAALVKQSDDATAGISGAFDLLDNDLPADVKAAISAAPECKVLNG